MSWGVSYVRTKCRGVLPEEDNDSGTRPIVECPTGAKRKTSTLEDDDDVQNRCPTCHVRSPRTPRTLPSSHVARRDDDRRGSHDHLVDFEATLKDLRDVVGGVLGGLEHGRLVHFGIERDADAVDRRDAELTERLVQGRADLAVAVEDLAFGVALGLREGRRVVEVVYHREELLEHLGFFGRRRGVPRLGLAALDVGELGVEPLDLRAPLVPVALALALDRRDRLVELRQLAFHDLDLLLEEGGGFRHVVLRHLVLLCGRRRLGGIFFGSGGLFGLVALLGGFLLRRRVGRR
mmetsp:Transcript_1907/g.7345  ORF Transcript_1907/g.7345 Transcript_1907/m.7345 type:complete len:292 (+) Transcript_1907:37-912(+)